MSFQFVNNPPGTLVVKRAVHCVFHDPRQRGVPSPTTSFRRSMISRRSQRRLHQRKRWRKSLPHTLGEHLNSFSFRFDVFTHSRQRSELTGVEHALEFIETVSAGRRGARIEGNLWTLWSHIDGLGNLFLYPLNNRIGACIRSTTETGRISLTITCSCTAECSIIFCVISPATICS